MTSARGIVGIIGIRTEIIGVRQYFADGREIERINDQIAAANKRVEVASTKAGTATKASLAAQTAAYKANEKAVLDLARAETLEARAAAGAAKIKSTPVLVTSQGVPTNQGALAEQAALEKEAQQARNEANASQKEFTKIQKISVAASAAELTLLEQHDTALARRTELTKRLNEAQTSRRNALTTSIALPVTAAIAVTAGAAIVSAAKYQQELSKINVLTEATDAQTKELGADFLKLSTQIPVSAAELAGAAYFVLSSGIHDVNVALEVTTQAAKTAVAAQTDIKDVVLVVTGVLNAYGKGVYTATQINDLLFAGARAGRAEFNDFANALGTVLPAAVALGIPLDQVITSLAVLTNGGLNAARAGTGLRAVLQDLAKGDASPQAAAALKAVGLTFEDFRKEIQTKGLPAAMVHLFELFKNNISAIEPIIPDIRALTAAYSAFGDSGLKISDTQRIVLKSVGIVDQAFAKSKDNVANLAKLFSNQLNVALIEIGDTVLPTVTKALQDLIKWIGANKESIAKFVSEGLKIVIEVIKDFVTGLGAIYTAMKSIVGQSDATKVALAGIGLALAWALPGGPILKGLALILTSIGLIANSGGKKDNSPKGIIDKFGLPLAGAIAGGAIGFGAGGPGGALLGAGIGSQGGSFLNKLIGLDKVEEDTKGVTEATDEYSKKLKELTDQIIPKLNTNVGGINETAKKTAEELKKLAEEFLNTGEAAGQVKSITEEFKKFGTISKELADAKGFSAAQAGQVQAVDAIIRAREREQNEIFNNIEAINAISGAYRRSAQVGKELLLDLSQASLEASQKALSDVFSRPTREVAGLDVGLARQQLNTAQITQRNNPAINALNQQLKNIDKQIAAQNRANQAANNAAQQRQKQQQKAQEAQQKAQEAEANARKLANLQAQINAERQLAALQKLIDVNNKSASDLQESFRKISEERQQKINEAIGRGDTATAITLTNEQIKAGKEYQAQQTALTKSTQNLTTQQKVAQEAEAERQRQQQLADAQFEAQQKQIDSTNDVTDSLDSQKEAQDAQTQALEDSKQAIQDQIDALQAPIDASKQQEQAIQDSISVFEAQTNILKALGVAANKTLLTQDQQRIAAEHFTKQIEYASGQAQTLAKSFYDFISGAKDADLKFKTLNGTLDIINSKTFDLVSAIRDHFDAEKAYGDLIKVAKEDLTTTFNNTSTQIAEQTKKNTETVQLAISNAFNDIQTQKGEIASESAIFKARMKDSADGIASNLSKLPEKFGSVIDKFSEKINKVDIGSSITSLLKKITGHAAGGIYNSPTLGVFGEAGAEAILPLTNPARSREIISQIPPSITASILNRNSSSAIFAPNINVSGETLDTMEATAIRAVQRAFRDARVMSGRQGGLITQGLGPSH